MEQNKLLSFVDHTLLNQTSSWDEIKQILDDGIKYKTASACIPPSFVKRAKEYVGKELKICTVVGFPNGYNTTETKCFEAKEAAINGADEIDIVINLGMVKEKRFDDVLNEINKIKSGIGDRVLKVIIETCLLSDEEKITLCKIVSKSDADFIKTSTGFSTGGATFEDIKLFNENVHNGLKIKAAGGISSLLDAEEFLRLGANRLGTSKIVKLIKEGEQKDEKLSDTSY